MNATQKGNAYEKEINGEMVLFYLTPTGIQIDREKHDDKFISYEDLMAKAENQLTMPI